MNNYSLDIKHTFLSFAQAFFAEHPKYSWDADISKTKVLIVDKYAVALKIIEAKRSIVLSRGPYGWGQTSLGQHGDVSGETVADSYMGTKYYSDLIRGSVTFNCIAQNGIVAEDLAHLLFTAFTAHKDQIRKNGMIKLNNMNIGEESVLKEDSSVELVAIPLHIQFETQKSLSSAFDYYEELLVTDQAGTTYYQGSDFTTPSNTVEFKVAPEVGTILTISYINAITLETVTEELLGDVDGSNKVFTYTYPAYTEYPLFENFETEAEADTE